MVSTQHYGAFNARWLSFEDVARTFVPVPQFLQLIHESHSVLLGPRGCGKTTLLKMLTTRSLEGWEGSDRANRFRLSFERPRYEAIYISSDVRWSYELASMPDLTSSIEGYSLPAQRIMVTINVLANLLDVIRDLLIQTPELESKISSVLIEQWNLTNTLKTLVDLKLSLIKFASDIRGYLNIRNETLLQKIFERIPPTFFGHTLDAPSSVIELVSDLLPKEILPAGWALCYDELEIAPEWLRRELLEALRSARQDVFLKLTWSPLLPSGLRTSPESAADFKPIRLWHSHAGDPRAFCEELTQDFLRERFSQNDLSPDDFFRRSILGAEENEEPIDSYERDSTEYRVFRNLASWDPSFAHLMRERDINPEDPVPDNLEIKDAFFRKVKPVALLRTEFLSAKRGRSRKAPAIYAGKEAIFSMSEGNPRWLRGLLNDFADLGGLLVDKESEHLMVRYKDQARVLSTAGQRFLSQIQASPFKPPQSIDRETDDKSITLKKFIVSVGNFFKKEIYDKDFPMDPIGSFVVPMNADSTTVAVVEQLLELGALVYIGASSQDIPLSVRGSRFRLSFILAPIFRLPLRTYREVDLSVLFDREDDKQLKLEF